MDCLNELNPKYDYTPEQFGMTVDSVKETLDRGSDWRYERDYFPAGTPDRIVFTWHPIIWIEGEDVGYVYETAEVEQKTNRPVKTRVESRGLNQDAHFVTHDMTVNSDGYVYHDGYWVGVLTGIEVIEN